MAAMHYDRDVVIVGAGAAGLAAAHECEAKGLSYIVVEASEKSGGRVQEMVLDCGDMGTATFAAGAEFVHGDVDNPLLTLLKKANVALVERVYPNYVYLGKEAAHLHADAALQQWPALKAGMACYDAILEAETEIVPGETLLQYFTRHNVPTRFLDLLDAFYANDYGDSSDALCAAAVQFEERAWKHGESYLIFEDGNTMSAAIRALSSGVSVEFHKKVKTVKHGAHGVSVVMADGATLTARAVICTAPTGVVRDYMSFEPPLPVAKAAAISGIVPGHALKVCVVLREALWPADWWDSVCADCVFPEVWRSTSKAPFVVVGFVMGARATRLLTRGREAVFTLLLQQLDTMFATPGNPRPATDGCVARELCDWGAHEHTRGGYTYPHAGSPQHRAHLAAPDGSGLFFAGEAANLVLNPCVQGAMESGVQAARAAAAHLAAQ
ncbi:hypothetical protein M885DRAFT_544599 [Pelagophyceae sp. CCMP2097]|nr:hypothetical protein M885DRAFT_544599 [Pelagophyceae sp. CCMP2097]|mmetsp:Transcript_124/g.475  ORF Transcript_124/g.475 Transcript_124/m.475 type:complete len:440 (-) Transcript_124:135-1454(-)|eukprot:CAMPEP_0184111738 /NCGR_PEP_ID=MMETSP0974-20121125/18060_1 /TAXON_ID=483370 /ORGANISM="non described non described, Strain CCMP2097" /LENGTH=439 /DNA_ID=CAMNT_0026414821 /DNA_START=4 /DNA_END=1323 /DNA_ORIENTATION=-